MGKGKEANKEKEKSPEKEAEHIAGPGVLRKRTLSGDPKSNVHFSATESPISPKTPSGAITLKPGEPVLPQLNRILGEADHSGFMLKKGERYSTWKSRFFFLKGPHVYYLRSKQVRNRPPKTSFSLIVLLGDSHEGVHQH